ncbi:hypothetical protein ACM67B_00525 [Neisseria sp. CCUG17229]|uniref:hypothetical protein n=1 Tax=Neisseria sp. CCUG17229 TaxID=3392036 RepID=UPI003A0FDAA2
MKKIILLFSLLTLSTGYVSANPTETEAKAFISEFYKQYVFSGAIEELDASRVGTPRFLRKLERAYTAEYDCEKGACYGVWALRTGAQDGEGISIISTIQPKSGGWYRVNYRDMGWKGVTDVKVVEVNGVIKLDDYKKIYDNVR